MSDLLGLAVAAALVALLWAAAFWVTGRAREWSGPGPGAGHRE
jgi:HAMP domain-containing protein